MKMRIGLVAAAAAALASAATGALAAGSVTATAPASVTVLSPFNITKTQDMLFGTVVRPSTGTTTITLDSNDAVSFVNTGGGNGSLVSSTTSSARFSLVGTATTTYTLSQSLAFTQVGLTGVSASTATASSGTLGTLPAGGTQEIRYGGQFTMAAATTPQLYTGTLSVTVNYN